MKVLIRGTGILPVTERARVAALGLLVSALSASAQTVPFTQTSLPPGIIDQSVNVSLNSTNATVTGRLRNGVSNGAFTFWTLNGVRQNGVGNTPQDPARFEILEATTATAVFMNAGLDADGDGIFDWYELQSYDSTNNAADSDSDLDGVTLQEEYNFDLKPSLSNRFITGVIAARESSLLTIVLASNLVHYTERSDPAGILSLREQVEPLGTTVQTRLIGVGTETQNRMFTQWSVNGERQANAQGLSLGRVSVVVTGATEALAHYHDADADLNQNGVPDWYEQQHYGTTNVSLVADADGDGIALLREYDLELSDSYSNRFVNGVIAGRESALITVYLNPVRYPFEQRSIPGGVFATTSTFLTNGTVRITPDGLSYESSSRRFTHWTLNGVRQSGPAGIALTRVSATMATSAVSLVAYYMNDATDATTNGVPDWFESRYLGSAGHPEGFDSDGDGLGLAREYEYDLNPAISNTVRAGIVSSGESLLIGGSPGSAEDRDADDLNDDWELLHFGHIRYWPWDDPDGDGVSLRNEHDFDRDPTLANTVFQGLIASRDSDLIDVNLEFFPKVHDVMLDGIPIDFFSLDTATNGAFLLGPNSHPALGDWDGDGDLDLFVGGAGGALRVFENTGSQVFMNLEERTLEFGAGPWTNINNPAPGLGDFNDDGLDDLAMGGDTNLIWLIASTGLFDGTASTNLPLHIASAVSAIPAFLNGGLLVLKDDGQVSLYTNLPAAQLSSANYLGTQVPDARGISVSDINDDGIPDVLVSDQQGRIWEFHGQ